MAGNGAKITLMPANYTKVIIHRAVEILRSALDALLVGVPSGRI